MMFECFFRVAFVLEEWFSETTAALGFHFRSVFHLVFYSQQTLNSGEAL